MNAPIRLAQAQSPAGTVIGQLTQRVLPLTHPVAGVVDIIQLRSDSVLDFSPIANDRMVLVHAGDRLILIFEDQAMIVLRGYYDFSSQPISGPLVEVGTDTPLTLAQFAATFPISNDISILPASGPAAPVTTAIAFQTIVLDPSLVTQDQTSQGLGGSSSFTSTGFLPRTVLQQYGITSATSVTPPHFSSTQTPVAADEAVVANSGSAQQITGKLTYDFGSTGAGSAPVRVDVANIAALTSGGQSVVYSWDQPSLTLTATAGAKTVFKLVITDAISGRYTFSLTGPLDHSGANGASLSLDLPIIVTAGNGAEARGTLGLTVADDVPLASNDSGSGNEDGGSIDVNLLANDRAGADGATVSVLSVQYQPGVTSPAGATASYILNSASGLLTLTPGSNWNGTATFTTRTTDADGDSSDAQTTIRVAAVNDAPVAVADSYSTDEDTALSITAAGVLTNDSDVEGDSLSASLVSTVAHGALTLNANGSFTYTPNANYFGADSFSYKASDGSASSTTVTVNLTVNPVNDAPDTNAASLSMTEDGGLKAITLTGSDLDGTVNAFAISTLPTKGTLFTDAAGTHAASTGDYTATGGSLTLYYLPTLNANGTDSFTFAAKDNSGTVDATPATASITIAAVNDAPVAVADSYSTDEDTPLVIAAGAGVLANDTDVDGNSLTTVLNGTPQHGTLSLNSNGSFTYTPTANYYGTDSFFYSARDGSLTSNIVMVNLTINPVADAPETLPVSFSAMNEDILDDFPGQFFLNPVPNFATDVDSEPVAAIRITNLPTSLAVFYGNSTGTGTPLQVGDLVPVVYVAANAGPYFYPYATYQAPLYFSQVPDANGTGTLGWAAVDSTGLQDPTPNITTFKVTARPDAPRDITLTASSIVENNTAGATVATLGVVDPDIGDTHTYAITGGTGQSLFTISGTALKASASLDYETAPDLGDGTRGYTLTLKVTDNTGRSYSETDTIRVTDQVEWTNLLVSQSTGGTQSNNYSFTPVVSSDGRTVAYTSYGDTLVAGDANSSSDIFLRDIVTGTTTRISLASDGTEGNSDSQEPSLSADGHVVAYTSWASNLVAGDTNGTSDIFITDTTTGSTQRVSVASDGTEGNGYCYRPAISGDGRYVVFESTSTNLSSDPAAGFYNIFLHDNVTGATTLLTKGLGGTAANSSSSYASISEDGHYATFYSTASNLVAGDTNNTADIFRVDLTSGVLSRVSVDDTGAQANGASYSPSISADGRYISFYSYATNLLSDDTNGATDIFVRDMVSGTVSRVSQSASDTQGNDYSYDGQISGDGTTVVFGSYATNLVSSDSNNAFDVFAKNLTSGEIALLSHTATGNSGNTDSYAYSSGMGGVASDGKAATYVTYATDLISGLTDANGFATDIVYASTSNGSRLAGTASGETITGTGLGDLIAGLGGDDILLGGYGDDEIWGDAGNDLLTGGGGADRLSGGAGADHFSFNALSEGGDSIIDFSAAEGDVIDLLASVFNHGITGMITASDITTVSTATADAGSAHFILVDPNGAGTAGGVTSLYYDSDGGAGVVGADRILIAKLENGAEIGVGSIVAV